MIGIAGRPRVFAFMIDNLIGIMAALLVVVLLKSENPYVNGVALCLTYLAYFFIFEALWSRTPGKYFQGLLVVSLDGERCAWRCALIRTLLRLVEANPLLLGGIPAALIIMATPRNQRLGDVVAGTLVVESRKG